MNEPSPKLPAIFGWTLPGRSLVFVLSAMSIWCLLAEMYHLCDMRTFTLYILIPATILLLLMAVLDRAKGDGRLWRAVVIGGTAGLLAAVAYDLFRLPWVLGYADKIGPEWLRLPLFKVFPRFGALILGLPFTDSQTDGQFPLAAHLVGWLYHLSNGITFGIMFMAIVGEVKGNRWLWAIALAAGLELAMLFTPYPGFFAIRVTALFVVVTLAAHLIFGLVLGLCTRRACIAVVPQKG